MHKSFASISALLCASTIIVSSATAQPTLDPAVEAKIQDIVNNIAPVLMAEGEGGSGVTLASRMAALHVPGVSIAVIHDGKIEWARGFGVTKPGGAPVTANTQFQAASISKPVTAMAVLHLVQSGQLNLDTDVNQYLQTWKVPENSFTAQKKVTLRELLSHTAGVTVHGFEGYASGDPVPTLVQVLNGEKPANTPAITVDTVPGTIWRYSGGGYVILQQLLLDITKKSFPGFMQDTVLGPMGMTQSTYEQPLPEPMQAAAAMPNDQFGLPIVGGVHTFPEMAPAGLWTTPTDLARYAIELQNSLAGRSNRVLSKAIVNDMVKQGGLGGWGLGLQVGGSQDHPYFEHDGDIDGFHCDLVAYDSGDGVIIMTNGQNGKGLQNEILRTVALEYHWPDFRPKQNPVAKLDSKVLDAYAGYYREGRFSVMNISRNGDHLTIKKDLHGLGDIYPTNDREWFSTNAPVPLSFAFSSNGAIAFVQRVNDLDLLAPRINSLEATQIAEELSAKVKNQTQDSNSEAELRRNIDEERQGKPDYNRMSPGLADATKHNLAGLQRQMVNFGAIKSISFKGASPAGADIYDVVFENGSAQWHIILGADGKTETIGFQRLP